MRPLPLSLQAHRDFSAARARASLDITVPMRQVRDRRDLAIIHVLDFPQYQDLAMLRRQPMPSADQASSHRRGAWRRFPGRAWLRSSPRRPWGSSSQSMRRPTKGTAPAAGSLKPPSAVSFGRHSPGRPSLSHRNRASRTRGMRAQNRSCTGIVRIAGVTRQPACKPVCGVQMRPIPCASRSTRLSSMIQTGPYPQCGYQCRLKK